MKEKNKFICTHHKDSINEIEIYKSNSLNIKKTYLKTEEMIIASKLLMKYRKNGVCFLPTSEVVEIMALGGDVLIDEKSTPRVGGYNFSSIEELLEFLKNKKNIQMNIIDEVIKSVGILRKDGVDVVLNISGVITILSGLVDFKVIIKGLKKNREKLYEVMNIIKDFVLEYAHLGILNGANIISYADPVGNMDILGEKTYIDLNREITLKLLKDIKNFIEENYFKHNLYIKAKKRSISINNTIKSLNRRYKVNNKLNKKCEKSILHICGRTTSSLMNTEDIKVHKIIIDEYETYKDALLKVTNKNTLVVGQNCIKKIVDKDVKNIGYISFLK